MAWLASADSTYRLIHREYDLHEAAEDAVPLGKVGRLISCRRPDSSFQSPADPELCGMNIHSSPTVQGD